MTLDEMIAVLEAAKRGEKIEFREVGTNNRWESNTNPFWGFNEFEYRVAPKMTLVEELQLADTSGRLAGCLLRRAANKIEELERRLTLNIAAEALTIQFFTNNDLLAEAKRRKLPWVC